MLTYFCYQGNDCDCGFASLKMLLATINKNHNFLYLTKPQKKGNYSFADIIRIASKYGLTLKAYRYRKEEEVSIKTPFLVIIDKNHLVLVKKVKSKRIIIQDPCVGIYSIKLDEFKNRFSGEVLEITDVRKVDYKKDHFHILSKTKIFLSFIISALAVASFLVGLFFVKKDTFVFVPIIFLSLFAILQLVEKWYLIKEINFFDNKYIDKYFIDSKDLKSDYKNYNEFKKNFFLYRSKIFSSFLIAVAIIITLIFNNPINAIAVFFILALSLLAYVLFYKNDRDVNNEITNLEDDLLKTKTDINYSIYRICNKANAFALNISLRKCIISFVLLILSLLMMIAVNEISVNFVLFNFFIYYILFENINNIIMFNDSKEEYLKQKFRFIDKCNI